MRACVYELCSKEGERYAPLYPLRIAMKFLSIFSSGSADFSRDFPVFFFFFFFFGKFRPVAAEHGEAVDMVLARE